MSLNNINEAIIVWREVLMKITGLSKEYILNGESLRGPELVVIKNNKKIPISNAEIAIIHYLDAIDEISIVDSNDRPLINQSYELHLIIYGNSCRKIAQRIKSRIYGSIILKMLREKGIGLLDIPSYENTSGFRPDNTYTLRYDVRIRFNCILEDEELEEKVYIEEVKRDIGYISNPEDFKVTSESSELTPLKETEDFKVVKNKIKGVIDNEG